LLTQVFGENKNRLFYGPKGHQGIDFRTKRAVQFLFHRLLGWVKKVATRKNTAGTIPIVAAHDGFLSEPFNDDKKYGIYMRVVAKPEEEGEKTVQYRTLYFHLDKVRVWKNDPITTGHELRHGENYIPMGAVVGYSGNTGRYTTGAHLHFQLERREKMGSGWGGWAIVDPMPYFVDQTIYQLYRGMGTPSRYFYLGKEITRERVRAIGVLPIDYRKV